MLRPATSAWYRIAASPVNGKYNRSSHNKLESGVKYQSNTLTNAVANVIGTYMCLFIENDSGMT